MKNYITIGILFLCSLHLFAQTPKGVFTTRAFYNQPSGVLGFLIEGAPGFSLSAGLMAFENRVNGGLIFGYQNMPSRHPEGRPTYGLATDLNSLQLVLHPGTETYSDGYQLSFGGYMDIRLLNEVVSPTIGYTLQVLHWSHEYSLDVPGLVTSEVWGGNAGFLVGYSLGVDYIHNETIKVQLGIQRTNSIYDGNPLWVSTWQPFLSGSVLIW